MKKVYDDAFATTAERVKHRRRNLLVIGGAFFVMLAMIAVIILVTSSRESREYHEKSEVLSRYVRAANANKVASMFFVDEALYFIDGTNRLYRFDEVDENRELICEIKASGGVAYESGNTIYFSDCDSIFKKEMPDGDTEILFGEGNIPQCSENPAADFELCCVRRNNEAIVAEFYYTARRTEPLNGYIFDYYTEIVELALLEYPEYLDLETRNETRDVKYKPDFDIFIFEEIE